MSSLRPYFGLLTNTLKEAQPKLRASLLDSEVRADGLLTKIPSVDAAFPKYASCQRSLLRKYCRDEMPGSYTLVAQRGGVDRMIGSLLAFLTKRKILASWYLSCSRFGQLYSPDYMFDAFLSQRRLEN